MSALAHSRSKYLDWSSVEKAAVSQAGRELAAGLDAPFPRVAYSVKASDLQRIEQPLVAAVIAAEESGINVKPASIFHALRFAQALPQDWPTPEIVVESDGDIAFDWENGRRRLLTIAVAPNGIAGFSALIGHEPLHGKVLLTGGVPYTVAFLMGRIL
jgi:hypothetical protein